jgi:ATP-dependent Clp protease ATP-binding subunit ClpA
MFERYTEKARRTIFFARYEASQFGSLYIETEYLLLGLLREDKALANGFLRSHAAVESTSKRASRTEQPTSPFTQAINRKKAKRAWKWLPPKSSRRF